MKRGAANHARSLPGLAAVGRPMRAAEGTTERRCSDPSPSLAPPPPSPHLLYARPTRLAYFVRKAMVISRPWGLPSCYRHRRHLPSASSPPPPPPPHLRYATVPVFVPGLRRPSSFAVAPLGVGPRRRHPDGPLWPPLLHLPPPSPSCPQCLPLPCRLFRRPLRLLVLCSSAAASCARPRRRGRLLVHASSGGASRWSPFCTCRPPHAPPLLSPSPPHRPPRPALLRSGVLCSSTAASAVVRRRPPSSAAYPRGKIAMTSSACGRHVASAAAAASCVHRCGFMRPLLLHAAAAAASCGHRCCFMRPLLLLHAAAAAVLCGRCFMRTPQPCREQYASWSMEYPVHMYSVAHGVGKSL